ncbi:DUF6522 family protein [Frigidibacter sp. ROC022]|uniref:DUF6522 family protein n=1 Tax=Frigidibacter sp. ROC022 TaxID=2971796 RepID=UPI00215AAF03|nr:DUF6522 family protein [Frigidibacter sp. ROC022]MCR8726123.1 DUF6522 family protein [Frigidibacter sp. ROC022]
MSTDPQIKPDFVVDAAVLGTAFGIAAAEVPEMLRSNAITSRCEAGVDADEGRWRLTFFHGGKALRLVVDRAGRILTRSTFPSHPPRPGAG